MPVYNSQYPRAGYLNSVGELLKGVRRGPLYHYLKHLARADVVYHEADFLEDTINADFYALANSAGTGAANLAINVQRDGVARMSTGTDDNGSVSAIGPLIYYGDANCGLEARFKVSAVTGYNLEIGFIDAVPGSNNGGVSDVDTPTANMTDGAVWHIDTDQTLTTAAFVTAGTSFTTTATTLANTGPSAATYMTVRIQLIGNAAFCWVNGDLQASHVGDKVEGGTALSYWLYARTRNTTTKNVDFDIIRVWQDRNV